MSRENQREWAPVKRNPVGYFQTADGILRSDRSLAGPLRLGTEPRVGPSGAIRNGSSDFEMDRITPRKFDPIGSHNTRAPDFPSSTLLSREARSRRLFTKTE
jgi:hypothetical protein